MNATSTAERKGLYLYHRRHGKTLELAAKAAGLTRDAAHRIEGRSWCDNCGDYVTAEDCPHWDYES